MVIVPILLWLNHAPVKKAHATALLIILPISIISGLFYLNLEGFDWSLFWQVGVGVLAGGAVRSGHAGSRRKTAVFLIKAYKNRQKRRFFGRSQVL